MADQPLLPETPAAEPASAFSQVNWSCVDAIFEEQSRSLAALAKAAGESPETFFVGRNFRGISLKNIDIRGVSLENANLVGTGVRFAVIDGTTRLVRAKMDRADSLALRRKGLLPVARRGNPYAGESFDQLLVRQNEAYVRGRNNGDNLALLVAIELARLAVRRASDAFQQGETYNRLGLALHLRAERLHHLAPLRQAVEAFRRALKKRTREREPLDWAMTQTNLGDALKTLGERERDPAMLKQAVEAYCEALQVDTHARHPIDWAWAQKNLGDALRVLAEEDENGPDLLSRAVEVYRAALKEYTRQPMSLDCPDIQHHLGNALRMLGVRESEPALLRQALEAYREALKEYTRERAPYFWAQTRQNMAIAFLAIYRLTGEEADRAQALEAVDDSLVVYRDAQSDYYIRTAEALRAEILAAAPSPTPPLAP